MFLTSLFSNIRKEISRLPLLRSERISLRQMIEEHGPSEIENIPRQKRRCILSYRKQEPPTFKYFVKLAGGIELVFFVMFDEENNLETMQSEKKRIEAILGLICIWMNIATEYGTPVCFPQKVFFFLYLLNLPKIIPGVESLTPRPDKTILGRNDVNSAFTFACSQRIATRNNICVFRKEEVFKVLIHETLHLIGIDISHLNATSSEDFFISQAFNLPHRAFIFEESYTEFLTTVIQCMFVSPTWSEFEEAVEFEKQFAVAQAIKVLRFNKLKYSSLVHGSQNNYPLYPYNESSAVFSYYILKTILLWNCFDFFQDVERPGVISREKVLNFILRKATDMEFVDAMSRENSFEKEIPQSSLCMTFHGFLASYMFEFV